MFRCYRSKTPFIYDTGNGDLPKEFKVISLEKEEASHFRLHSKKSPFLDEKFLLEKPGTACTPTSPPPVGAG